METEDERRARLENNAATKQLRLVMEIERKARLVKMVVPHSSGWPWKQRTKEVQKNGLDLDLIWI